MSILTVLSTAPSFDETAEFAPSVVVFAGARNHCEGYMYLGRHIPHAKTVPEKVLSSTTIDRDPSWIIWYIPCVAYNTIATGVMVQVMVMVYN
jgi:hypothetical protein